jgi:hypothetical protein
MQECELGAGDVSGSRELLILGCRLLTRSEAEVKQKSESRSCLRSMSSHANVGDGPSTLPPSLLPFLSVCPSLRSQPHISLCLCPPTSLSVCLPVSPPVRLPSHTSPPPSWHTHVQRHPVVRDCQALGRILLTNADTKLADEALRFVTVGSPGRNRAQTLNP